MENQATTPAVQLKGDYKRFGKVVAVQKMDFDFEEGTLVTLLGPSGCGKTTILRMIAGLESPTEGDIYIKGRRVNDIPIHKRNLGMIFQNYALFPHKTIFDNVAFGLKYRSVSKEAIREKVAALLGETEADAEKLKANLAFLGLQAEVQKVRINGQNWHRVRTGPYADRKQLFRNKQLLSNNGINAISLELKQE
mgnify:CR=1 FL=1